MKREELNKKFLDKSLSYRELSRWMFGKFSPNGRIILMNELRDRAKAIPAEKKVCQYYIKKYKDPRDTFDDLSYRELNTLIFGRYFRGKRNRCFLMHFLRERAKQFPFQKEKYLKYIKKYEMG